MLTLVALPAFEDNYIWMLHDQGRAVVVDPGDAAPVLTALATKKLSLAAILVTHHHPDHVGGIDGLRHLLDGPVFGPAGERIPEPCQALAHDDVIEVLGLRLRVVDVPGHTAGHIAYVEEDSDAPLLFCGDTLFSAGCGRLFEGTPAQMLDSLHRLAALPSQTRVCCTHEYTLSNMKFALAVEPANEALELHHRRAKAARAAGRPTLPSTLEIELQINPFLRCREPAVVATALAHGATGDDELSVFAALREWKNVFR